MPVTERDMSPEPTQSDNKTFQFHGKKYEITPVWHLYASNFLSDLQRHFCQRVKIHLLPHFGVTKDFETAKLGYDMVTLATAIDPVLNTLDELRLCVQSALTPADNQNATPLQHEKLAQLLLPISQTQPPTPQAQYDHATLATYKLLDQAISSLPKEIRLSTNYHGLQIDMDELPEIARSEEQVIHLNNPLTMLSHILKSTYEALRGSGSFYTSQEEHQESIKNLQEGLSLVNKHLVPLGAPYHNTPEDFFLMAYQENLKSMFSQFNRSLTKTDKTANYAPSVGFLLSTLGLAELPLDSPRMAESALPEKPSALLLSELNIFMITLEHYLNMGSFEDIITATARQRLQGPRPNFAMPHRHEKMAFQLATRKMSGMFATAIDAVESLIRTKAGYEPKANATLKKAGILNTYPPPAMRQ